MNGGRSTMWAQIAPLQGGRPGLALALCAGLGAGCVDSDKLGGQDGEEGQGDVGGGNADGAGDGIDDGGAADGSQDGGDGSAGDTGAVEPPDRAGDAQWQCVRTQADAPGTAQSTAAWVGVLGPARTGCSTCDYDFSVAWSLVERTDEEGAALVCPDAPGTTPEVYAVRSTRDAAGIEVLRQAADGTLQAVATLTEGDAGLAWQEGEVDALTTGPDGSPLYTTTADRFEVDFRDP